MTFKGLHQTLFFNPHSFLGGNDDVMEPIIRAFVYGHCILICFRATDRRAQSDYQRPVASKCNIISQLIMFFSSR